MSPEHTPIIDCTYRWFPIYCHSKSIHKRCIIVSSKLMCFISNYVNLYSDILFPAPAPSKCSLPGNCSKDDHLWLRKGTLVTDRWQVNWTGMVAGFPRPLWRSSLRERQKLLGVSRDCHDLKTCMLIIGVESFMWLWGHSYMYIVLSSPCLSTVSLPCLSLSVSHHSLPLSFSPSVPPPLSLTCTAQSKNYPTLTVVNVCTC